MDDLEPKFDEEALTKPVTRFELWQAIMGLRLSILASQRATRAITLKDKEEYADATASFAKFDRELQELCDRLIGAEGGDR